MKRQSLLGLSMLGLASLIRPDIGVTALQKPLHEQQVIVRRATGSGRKDPAAWRYKRSKYVPHQGARECARRRRQMGLA
jgi:hypothetical protein